MLEVIQPGPLVTVQDAGRFGLRAFGVSAAGPMDPALMALANALVGNPEDAAALEFGSFGGTFRAGSDMFVAVTGADASLWIDNVPAPPCQTLPLAKGRVLRVGSLAATVWGYIALSGGITTDPVMGSRSTQLRFALGGHEGRVLQPGDRLPTAACDSPPPLRKSDFKAAQVAPEIRVLPGPQDDYFDAEVLRLFYGTDFSVSPKFDRMAMTLEGPEIIAAKGHDIISDGTLPGSIQVPGSGKPLVLMAEGQTTGGYPKIATVIGADLPRLAQMQPGTQFRFRSVTLTEAEEALFAAQKAQAIQISQIRSAGPVLPSTERLLSVNLISGVWQEDGADNHD